MIRPPAAKKNSRPSKAYLLLRPVFRIQSVKPDFPAGRRRVHKTATSDINASVCRDVALGKNDKVTGTNIFTRYRLAPSLQHKHSPRWYNTSSRSVNVANQPTAVKTGIGCVAPKAIGRTDKADGIESNFVGLFLRNS